MTASSRSPPRRTASARTAPRSDWPTRPRPTRRPSTSPVDQQAQAPGRNGSSPGIFYPARRPRPMKHTTQDRRERDPDPRTPTPPPTAAKPRNHPAHEVAMIGLALAQAGINCFLDEHEDLDDCQICDLPVLH